MTPAPFACRSFVLSRLWLKLLSKPTAVSVPSATRATHTSCTCQGQRKSASLLALYNDLCAIPRTADRYMMPIFAPIVRNGVRTLHVAATGERRERGGTGVNNQGLRIGDMTLNSTSSGCNTAQRRHVRGTCTPSCRQFCGSSFCC